MKGVKKFIISATMLSMIAVIGNAQAATCDQKNRQLVVKMSGRQLTFSEEEIAQKPPVKLLPNRIFDGIREKYYDINYYKNRSNFIARVNCFNRYAKNGITDKTSASFLKRQQNALNNFVKWTNLQDWTQNKHGILASAKKLYSTFYNYVYTIRYNKPDARLAKNYCDSH